MGTGLSLLHTHFKTPLLLIPSQSNTWSETSSSRTRPPRRLLLFLSVCSSAIGQDLPFEIEETVVIASRTEEKTSQSAGSSAAITSEDILALGATNLTDETNSLSFPLSLQATFFRLRNP